MRLEICQGTGLEHKKIGLTIDAEMTRINSSIVGAAQVSISIVSVPLKEVLKKQRKSSISILPISDGPKLPKTHEKTKINKSFIMII
jgi:hypothetical protein